LLATQDTHPRLTQGPLAVAHLVRMMLESLVTVGMLALSAWHFGETFSGPYMILALLVFSLTFPGHAPRGTSPGAIFREVLADWLLVLGLLLMLGWATRTVGSFDERVMVTWAITAPIVLFFAHMAMPVILPKLMAAEGMNRVAVIAGAGALGHKLAERIRTTPFLGVQVAGYFDDRSTQRLEGVHDGEVLGNVEGLAEYVKKNRVDLIYLTLPMASQPRIMKLLDDLRDTTASVYFIPDIFLFDLIQGRMDSIGGLPVLAVCETPFFGMNAMVKRASDVILGTLILVAVAPGRAAVARGV
jgi:putative colanic acid biosynthesis UDP-glucose lipid carrier transferase